MRTTISLAFFALLAGSVHALPSDIKVLAQFDLGYAQCEARFTHMRGKRDEAYLALWKVKPGDKQRAELATVRKSAKYRQERQQARQAMGKAAGLEHEEKLKQQCQATWGETLRNTPQLTAR